MLILGWHGNPQPVELEETTVPRSDYHDASAVILRDGVVVAAIEEERLSREKHDRSFPQRAIRFCLEQAHATLRDVDAIATGWAEEVADFSADSIAVENPSRPFTGGRDVVARMFQREFQVDVADRLHFCKHHLAHLYSACYPSGFHEGMALCLDAAGDGSSGLIAKFKGAELQVLRYLSEAQSLGHFYEEHLFFLGYRLFDEYKAMGLAPYGEASSYASYFNSVCKLRPEGKFEIVPPQYRLTLMRELGMTAAARRKGQPFAQPHMDFAAGLQAALERIVEHMVRHYQQVTGARRLCIAGGVGHNCTLNGKLMRSGLFEQVYVAPASHDAGISLGAALCVARARGEQIRSDLLPHVFLGTDAGRSDEIAARLRTWGGLLHPERVDDPAKTAAQLIAGGSVIAWVQGRSEFGPRALGNRSILADPRPAENKQIINRMIKKREEYRPFAPAVLEENLRDYFEVPANTPALPFMVFVTSVRQEKRNLLGAITHVDGSARVQSVSREHNPLFHSLIAEFGRLTGVEVVLNTSLNNDAEPIVDSVDDAIATLLTTGLHALIVGDWLVRRPSRESLLAAIPNLLPSLACRHRLIRWESSSEEHAPLRIGGPPGRFPPQPPIPVSPEVFRLLLEDSTETIRSRCDRNGYGSVARERICSELLELWAARSVRLTPPDQSVRRRPQGESLRLVEAAVE